MKIRFLLVLSFAVLFVQHNHAQEKTITGTVKNEAGTPLANVVVHLRDSENSTTTEQDGTYSINVSQENLTLLFSLEGYKDASASLGIYTAIDMVMVSKESGQLSLFSLEDLMDMTIVSASKKEEKVSDAPSNITVITAQTIKEWGSRDLKDVMRRVTGYNVIADRDEWVFASRGNVSDNNQKYLILIDGHRMNSIENFGPGNIIEIPNNLSNVKRLEIIRGPGSAVWGADALAGVINILTKNAEDIDGNANVAVTYGQDNYMLADFQIGKKISENVEIAFMGSFSKQDGREIKQEAATGLPYLETEYNYGSHPHGKYNTILDKHNFGYMLQMKARVDKFSINAYTFETEVFNRHFEWGLGRENYLTTNKGFIEAAYNNTLFGDMDLTVKLSTDQNYAEYSPRTQGDSTKLPFNIAWRDRGMNASIEAFKPLGKFLNIYGGVDYKFTKLGPNQRINGINPDSPKTTSISITDSTHLLVDTSLAVNTITVNGNGFFFDPYLEDHQIGGYLMLDIKPIDRITLTIGTRLDFNEQRGDDHLSINPRAALVLTPFNNTSIKAIYNTGYLRPANFQAAGADNVESEKMQQFDFIIQQKVGSANLALTLYTQKLTGFINILPGFGFANTGDYKSKGVEFEAVANINRSLNIWGNATYNIAEGDNFPTDLAYNNKRVDMDGKLLSYPSTNVNAGATVRLFSEALYISPAIRYVPATKYRAIPAADLASDTEDNYQKTSPFTFVDLNIGYSIKKLTASVYVDNLFNITKPTHLTVWNGTIEQYGRHISGKIRYRF